MQQYGQYTEIVLVAVVFTVSALIIRNLFNRFWNNIPKENRNTWNNAKNSIKRRFSKKSDDKNKVGDDHESFNPHSNEDHGPYQPMGNDDMENPRKAKPEESKGQIEVFKHNGKIIKAIVVDEGPLEIPELTDHVIKDLEEIVQIDGEESPRNNYMVMNEDEINL